MVSSHHLPEKAFCRGNIAFRREHELDPVALRINGTVQVFPRLSYFDVCLIHAVRGSGQLQVMAHSFVDLRRVTLDLAKHGRMLHEEAALTHHLFDITVGKLIAKIRSDAQKNDFRLEVTHLKSDMLRFMKRDHASLKVDERDGLHSAHNCCNTSFTCTCK